MSSNSSLPSTTKIGLISIALLSILLIGGALADSVAYSSASTPSSTQAATTTLPSAPATWYGLASKFLSGPFTATPSFGPPPSSSSVAPTSPPSKGSPELQQALTAKPLAAQNKEKTVPASVNCPGSGCDTVSTNSGGAKTNPLGVNAFETSTTFSALSGVPGYIIEPPDQGLCGNSQYVVEPENIGEVQVYSASTLQPVPNGYTTFDSMMGLASHGPSGWSSGGDIMCNYDYANGGHWFFTEIVSTTPEAPLVSGGQPGPFQGCIAGVKGTCREGLAVSVTSNPLGKYWVYFFNPNLVNNDPGVGYLLNDFTKDAVTNDAFLMFYDEFNFNSSTFPPCPAYGCGGFNGAQEMAFSKTGLESGWSTSKVTVAYENMGTASNLYPIPANGQFQSAPASCASGAFAGAVCWYQVIPAQTPDPSQFDNSNGGTGFMVASLDFFGAGDNRVAVFDWTGLSALNSAGCSSCSKINFGGQIFKTSSIYRDEGEACLVQYGGYCGLGKQKAGPIPLGRNCYLTPSDGTKSCPEGGIATNGDGTTQASYADGQIWTSVSTALTQNFGKKSELHVGAVYWSIGVSTTGSLSVTSHGYISAAHEDIEFPAIAGIDGGGALVTFTLSGKSYYPSTAYGSLSPTATGLASGVIHVADLGKGAQDGFSEYQFYPSVTRPRWGDYSAAIYVPGLGVLFATEYIEHQNCGSNTFLSDGGTCGNTRAEFANWGSSVNLLP